MPFMTRTALAIALSLTAAPALAQNPAPTSQAPLVTIYKDPSCGCCTAWGDHMAANGFRVEVKNTDALDQVKTLMQVPDQLQSCHTATVNGYVIEGHVPATDVHRLLAEAPATIGLAVPGMPQSSPGMDVPGATDTYDVISFDSKGQMSRFNSH